MSARLTVVLDDEELYRRLKVKAAQDGVPMKDLIEAGLRLVVGEAQPDQVQFKPFDWDRYEEMMEQWREEDRLLGVEASDYPSDLSDVKHHLYGHPKQPGPADRQLRVAEERAAYDAD